MNTDTIVTLVSSLGFPICCCVAMGYFIFKQMDKTASEMKEERKLHKEEVDNLSKVIENNTLVLSKILSKLGED